jgi:hypothetical protein
MVYLVERLVPFFYNLFHTFADDYTFLTPRSSMKIKPQQQHSNFFMTHIPISLLIHYNTLSEQG